MKHRTAIAALLLALAAQAAGAFQVESLSLHLHLAGLKNAAPPQVVEGYLILTAEGSFRHVGASFAHESFRTVHSFQRNAHGLFILAVPVPYEVREPLKYRLVVDGIWGRDAVNPEFERDPRTGAVFSLAAVPFLSSARPGAWNLVAEDGRTARFRYESDPGLSVAVIGDFNAWDPFVHELKETRPGVYELALPLPSGEHRYAFLVRGDRVPDPLNPARLYDSAGRTVSVLRIR
ncbi:MAG TPA: hypothetical protein P5117_14695 [Spirochaetia bacterium]|nr:hypothetical protein [Spirochaetia bacterium]